MLIKKALAKIGMEVHRNRNRTMNKYLPILLLVLCGCNTQKVMRDHARVSIGPYFSSNKKHISFGAGISASYNWALSQRVCLGPEFTYMITRHEEKREGLPGTPVAWSDTVKRERLLVGARLEFPNGQFVRAGVSYWFEDVDADITPGYEALYTIYDIDDHHGAGYYIGYGIDLPLSKTISITPSFSYEHSRRVNNTIIGVSFTFGLFNDT